MKMILLGYPDKDAKGPAKVLAGPEVSIAEQTKQMIHIKGGKNYPPGIVRVELCTLVPSNIGILISAPSAEATTETQSQPKKSKK